MEIITIPSSATEISLGQVWTVLQRLEHFTREQNQKHAKEIRELKEQIKELENQINMTARSPQIICQNDKKAGQTNEMDWLIEETEQRIYEKSQKFFESIKPDLSDIIKHTIAPILLHKFQDIGFTFLSSSVFSVISDSKLKILAEIDITLKDADQIMLIEVKSEPSMDDIDEHIGRIRKIRTHYDSITDKRKYLGAMVGIVFNELEKEYALKNGLYVIEPSGESFQIHVPEEPYSVKEW